MKRGLEDCRVATPGGPGGRKVTRAPGTGKPPRSAAAATCPAKRQRQLTSFWGPAAAGTQSPTPQARVYCGLRAHFVFCSRALSQNVFSASIKQAVDTPLTLGNKADGASWPSTAQRQLEKFAIDSPKVGKVRVDDFKRSLKAPYL